MKRTLSFLGIVGVACCLGRSVELTRAGEGETAEPPLVWTLSAGEGKYEITVDTSDVPDLAAWSREKLSPVLVEWYPNIVDMLPSDGFEAPAKLTVTFREDYRGVAATAGTQIRCAAEWFRKNLDGEARGAVVHELVHVVQQYRRGRRRGEGSRRPPGWLVEGIADQIRWFIYEPETRGAEITRRNLARARYDRSYRVSANFLDWVSRTYDKAIVRKLNAEIRAGRYNDEIWKELCRGRTVEELGDEWKKSLEAALGVADAPSEDAAAGATESDAALVPLFPADATFGAAGSDGVSGGWVVTLWSDLSKPPPEGARWEVRDGILRGSGARGTWLVSEKTYEDFELAFDFRLGPTGNSGCALRTPLKGDPAFDALELQMVDLRYKPDALPSELTGALYRALAPREQVYRPEQWNSYHIRLVGSRIRVVLNDATIVDTDLAERKETGKRHDGTDALPLSERPRRGRIGFQELGRGEERVEIRNARVRELSGR